MIEITLTPNLREHEVESIAVSVTNADESEVTKSFSFKIKMANGKEFSWSSGAIYSGIVSSISNDFMSVGQSKGFMKGLLDSIEERIRNYMYEEFNDVQDNSDWYSDARREEIYQQFMRFNDVTIEEAKRKEFLQPDDEKEKGVEHVNVGNVGNKEDNVSDKIVSLEQSDKTALLNQSITLADFMAIVDPSSTDFKYIYGKVKKKGERYELDLVTKGWLNCNNCLTPARITYFDPPVNYKFARDHIGIPYKCVYCSCPETMSLIVIKLDNKSEKYGVDIEIEDEFGNNLPVIGVKKFNFSVKDDVLIYGRLLNNGSNNLVFQCYQFATIKELKNRLKDQTQTNEPEAEDKLTRLAEIIYKKCQDIYPQSVSFPKLLLDITNEYPDIKNCGLKVEKDGRLNTSTRNNPKLKEFRDEVLDGYQGKDGKGRLKKIGEKPVNFVYEPKPKEKETISINPI